MLGLFWVFIIVISSFYSFSKVNSTDYFESNILSLIPSQIFPVEDPLLKEHLQRIADRSFVVLVKEEDEIKGLAKAKELFDELQKIDDISLTKFNPKVAKEIEDFYFPFRHQLLTPETRDLLQRLDPQRIAERELKSIYSPLRKYSPYKFQEDPFNLGGTWISSLIEGGSDLLPTEIPSIEGQEGRWYLVAGKLHSSPFKLKVQQELLKSLRDFRSKKNSENLDLLTSGLIFHASEGATIAKKEISTVGAGSLLAIVLLVLIVFRSWSSFLFIGTVLAASTLISISVTWLFFEKIHLVTLAFGSTLLGLAADYSFHFLAKFRATGDSKITRNILLKGLIISALSSIFAYLIFLFSPFPGLQQFSVFVASGLAAACITVLIIGPLFKKSSPNSIGFGKVFDSFFKPLYKRVAKKRGLIFLVSLITIFFAIGNIYLKGANDDIRQLNTSGDLLLESEKKVQKLLGNFSKQRYFLIEGESQQEVLERTELLLHELLRIQPIHFSKREESFFSPTAVIPSLHQQKLDYELIKQKIFSEKGAGYILCEELQSDCLWMGDQLKFNPNLIPISLPNIISEINPTISLLSKNKSVVFFKTKDPDHSFSPSSFSTPGVSYFDQVNNLTSILEEFRKQVSWLLICFFLLMAIASLVLFGKKGILIITVISFSSVVALSFSAGTGITLFHLLALLLVIGIAVDTAVFFITPGLNRDTWSASTLACLTSATAFGLLSLSNVPLLHYFGSVVLFGLMCTWLISPLIYFLIKEY